MSIWVLVIMTSMKKHYVEVFPTDTLYHIGSFIQAGMEAMKSDGIQIQNRPRRTGQKIFSAQPFVYLLVYVCVFVDR